MKLRIKGSTTNVIALIAVVFTLVLVLSDFLTIFTFKIWSSHGATEYLGKELGPDVKRTIEESKELSNEYKRKGEIDQRFEERRSKLLEKKQTELDNNLLSFETLGPNSLSISINHRFNRELSQDSIQRVYSMNGSDFKLLPNEGLITETLVDTFKVHVIDSQGKTIRKQDYQKWLDHDLEEKVGQLKKYVGGVSCKPMYCKFYSQGLELVCGQYIASATLYPYGDNFGYKVHKDKCPKRYQGESITLSTSEFGGRRELAKFVRLEVRLKNGETENLQIKRSGHNIGDANWKQLSPLIANQHNQKHTPTLLSRYIKSENSDQFEFQTDAAFHEKLGDLALQNTSTVFIVSTNGKSEKLGPSVGSVRVQPLSKKYFGVMQDLVDEVGIYTVASTGEQFGPYWYVFNPSDILFQTIEENSDPIILCRLTKKFGKICYPEQPADWTTIKRVGFSATPNKPKKMINVDYTPQEHLDTKSCRPIYNPECLPFFFKVPKDWNHIHVWVVPSDEKKVFSKMLF